MTLLTAERTTATTALIDPEPAVEAPVTTHACADKDNLPYSPEIFFPTHRDQLDAARSFCNRCPRQVACYREGVTMGAWGVWGGFYMEDGVPQKRLASR